MPLHPVCATAELLPGERKIIAIGKVSVGVFNVGGEYYAYRNICPHAGAPVCMGKIEGTTLPSAVYEYEYGRKNEILRCPWHGWEFDLKTGEHLVDPETRLKKIPLEVTLNCPPGHGGADENLEKYPVEIQSGVIHVRLGQ